MLLRLVAILAAGLLAADAFGNSDGTSHTGRTWRDVQSLPTAAQQDAASCGGCHGATRGTITVSLIGPASLAPNQQGDYTVSLTGGTNGDKVGVVISSTDSVAANPFSGTAPLTQASFSATSHNLVHVASVANPLTPVTGGGASYTFKYTMPPGATVGSSRTLHAVVRTGISAGTEARWNHANLNGSGIPQGLVVTTAAPPPTAPTSLTAGSKTSTSTNVSWGGGGPAYRLVYKTGATAPVNQTDGTALDFAGTTTTTNVTGLTSGPNYTFRIFARSADSSQFAAGPSLLVVLPPSVTSSSAQVNGTVNTALPAYSITATNSPTSYSGSGLPPNVNVNSANGAVSGAPTAKGTYTASLSATNAGGTGSISKTYVIAGLTQTITFGAAPTPTYSPFGTFNVTASSNSGQSIVFSTVSSTCSLLSSTSNSATFTMLSAGTCQVRANEPFGNSQYEPAAQVTQDVTIAATAPGAPTINSIDPGNGTGTVNFTAPSNNGGAAISGYTASCTPGPVTAPGTTSPITVTGLTNGTPYSCTLTATNSAGTSVASAPVGVTPTADPDGKLDPLFGSAGLSAAIFSGSGESARAIVVDRDQRIYVGGAFNSGGGAVFAVARFSPDGTLDTKFGKNGVAAIEAIGVSGAIEGLAIMPDGRILFAGGADVSGNNATFTVGRLLPEGALDESFGGAGFLKLNVSKEQGLARAIAYDERTGAIYAAGWDKVVAEELRAVVVRMDDRGELDAGFGKGGILRVPLGVPAGGLPEGAATGLAVDSSGRAVVSGFADFGSNFNIFVLRADPKGLDGTFGSGGVNVHDTGGTTDVAFAMRLDEKDRANVAGYTNAAGGFDFLLVRFDQDGGPDSQVVSDQGGAQTDLGTSLVITPDGKRLVGGVRNAGANSFDFAFARFLDGGTLDTSFGGSGRVSIPIPGTDQIIAMQAQWPGTVVGLVQTGGQQRVARFAIESPLPFAFTPPSVTGGTQTLVQSSAVALQGLAGETYVVVQGGEWSRNCAPGGFTGAIGSVIPGDSVCVRHVSSANAGQTTTTTITVGGQSATFASTPNAVVQPKQLSVTKTGAGSGVVSSSPAGISCGATCNASFPTNQPVSLFASPLTGSVFTGWGGACTGTGACNVTMSATTSVTANFALQQFALTVAKSGAGTGTVSSNPAGIDCGATCTANFNSGAVVALTPTPAAGSVFTGWSGACTGTGACNVTMSAIRSVTATFALQQFALTVSKAGAGSGTVSSNPAGIDCGATCSANYNSDVTVALAATPAGGSTFTGWSGACTGTGACNVAMTAVRSVTASFALAAPSTFALTVSKSGAGTGTITSNPAGINCGAACTANFNVGGSAMLAATAGAGSFFAGWSGACAGTGACNVTMDAAKSVNAEFKPNTTIPRLANIATRMQVLTGADVLIGGFIIGGSQAKTVVVRARGPSLTAAGVPGALQNPLLQLFSGQTVIAANDDWQQATNAAALQTSGFAPADPKESAILITLGPGAYTAIVSGVGNTTGVGIVEVFEVDLPQVPLINIATRGQVLTAADVMIGGFIIQGDAPQTVIVRARGPSLTAAGVPGALQDPVLQLFSGQTQIGVNDDWQTDSNASQINSRGFAPADPRESAILVTLPPGAYTAIVTGKNGSTGVGIIEVFAQ